MNHPWQQPIRPLDFWYKDETSESRWQCAFVLFIRPTDNGYEVMDLLGKCRKSGNGSHLNLWTDL